MASLYPVIEDKLLYLRSYQLNPMMTKSPIILVYLLLLLPIALFSQNGTIEADKVTADSLVGDGSRITGIQNQNLAVSMSGDTLFITEGNWVLIPGLSASNSGNAFANAGVDIVNACQTSFNLNAAALTQTQTGLWTIESGIGGNLVNATHPNAQFIGQEGESYVLKWTVMEQGGSSSFDLLNVSIAINTETSIANAGQDLFAIMTQTVAMNGNTPEMGSNGEWEILDGVGGILGNMADPMAEFTGVPGESYTLQWRHFNDCSTSTDEVVLTFSSSASGVPSANGRYFIPDPKFRQYLQIAYPSVMDGDSLIVASGDKVDELRLVNLGIINLDGLQYLSKLTLFDASGNTELARIPFFPNTLRQLVCNPCNGLEIIPSFPENLDSIIGSYWQLETLPAFPNGLEHLHLVVLTQLTSMPRLPDSCSYVYLSYIGTGSCCPPTVFVDTLNIPEFATTFHALSIGVATFPLLPTNMLSLQTFEVTQTYISEMPSLRAFSSLTYLTMRENSLFVLDSVPDSLHGVSIQGNPIICVKNKPPLVADQLSQYDICPEN